MKTLRALFWGGVVGATLGLLFAPRRGDVTRTHLRERLDALQLDALQQERVRRTPPPAAAAEQGVGLVTKAAKSQRHAANKAARNAWETSKRADQHAHESLEPAANA